jgi:hypothetical protein
MSVTKEESVRVGAGPELAPVLDCDEAVKNQPSHCLPVRCIDGQAPRSRQ